MKAKIPGGSQFIGKDGLTHYQRNKQTYIDKNTRRRRTNILYVRSIKSAKGCTDCGIKDWRVLDFDHIPDCIKLADISSMKAMSWGRKKLDEELAKCEVVCANDHRIRTLDRAGVV